MVSCVNGLSWLGGYEEGCHACTALRKNVRYVQGNSKELQTKAFTRIRCRNARVIFHSCRNTCSSMTQLERLTS